MILRVHPVLLSAKIDFVFVDDELGEEEIVGAGVLLLLVVVLVHLDSLLVRGPRCVTVRCASSVVGGTVAGAAFGLGRV